MGSLCTCWVDLEIERMPQVTEKHSVSTCWPENPLAKYLIPPWGGERKEGSRSLARHRHLGTHITNPAASCLVAFPIYLPPHSLVTNHLFPPFFLPPSISPSLTPSFPLFLRMPSSQLLSSALSVSSGSSHGTSANRPRLAGCQFFLLFILSLSV